MTTLTILADYGKKRLKCYGAVAAGEHVAVTVTDGAQWLGEGMALRLRVLFGPNAVAVVPFYTEAHEVDGTTVPADAWQTHDDDETIQAGDCRCELNLNTVQAEKFLKFGGTCMFILDDVENHTLYATGEFDVMRWPKRRGVDAPIDLDGYPDLMADVEDLKAAVTSLGVNKVDKIEGKGLSANDFTDALKTKLDGIAAGATNVTVDAALDGTSANPVRNSAVKAALDTKADASAVYTKSETDAAIQSKAADTVASIVASADSDFDTLKEIADWIKNDTTGAAKMASDISTLQSGKVDKVQGKGLSTNDYTTAEKNKLAACKTKAELDAGWFSDWTYDFFGNGEGSVCTVAPHYENGQWLASFVLVDPVTGDEYTFDDKVATGEPSEDALRLDFTPSSALDSVYATRHRVAAPIPAKTSELTNDSGFVTESDLGADYWTAPNNVVLPRIAETETGYMSWGPNGASGSPILDYEIAAHEYSYYDGSVLKSSQSSSYTGEETRIDFGSGVVLLRTYGSLVHRSELDNVIAEAVPAPSTATPSANGTAAAGSSSAYARGDHVHPTDTTRAPLASPAFTGTPTAPTPSAGDDSTKVATTAFVQGAARYDVVTPTVTQEPNSEYLFHLPSSLFPIAFTYDGQSYSLTDDTGLSFVSYSESGNLVYNGVAIAFFPFSITNGVVIATFNTAYAGISNLTFGGTAPVADTSPVLPAAFRGTLTDRAANVVPLDAAVGKIDFTLPAAVSGKCRDFIIYLTFGSAATDTGELSLTFAEPGTGRAMSIDFGADALANIAIGRNLVLLTEIAPPTTANNTTTSHWLVTVRHEDFAAAE